MRIFFLILFYKNILALDIFYEFSILNYTKHKKTLTYPQMRIKQEFKKNNFNFLVDLKSISLFDKRFKDCKLKIERGYFSFFKEFLKIKMGYEKLTWGKLLNLSLLDITNPFVIRRLFLEDEKISAKLPQFLFHLSSFKEDLRVDFLMSLFTKGLYDDLSEKESYFFPGNIFLIKEEPPQFPDNLEVGIKLTKSFLNKDFGFYYYKNILDFGIYELAYFPNLFIKRIFSKEEIFGIDFEGIYKENCIKAEVVFYPNKNFQKKSLLEGISGRFIGVGFGVDREIPQRDLSFVAEGVYTKAFVEDIEGGEENFIFSLNIKKNFWYGRNKVNILWLKNISQNSDLLKLSNSFELREHIKIKGGYVLFCPRGDDFISPYKNNDFIFIVLEVDL